MIQLRTSAARGVLAAQSSSLSSSTATKRCIINQLLRWVDSYRQHGHLFAGVNPLSAAGTPRVTPDRRVLSPATFGLSPSDLTVWSLDGVMSMPSGVTQATVAQMQQHLENTYCSSIGVETQYVATDAEREWLNNYLESASLPSLFSTSAKLNIYHRLLQSEFFDHFMSKKFTSFKRYGLEGAEASLVALEVMLATASTSGYEKVVLGMPHRGRLNLLVSLLDYPARALFAKVKGKSLVAKGSDSWDDVASHIATSVSKKFGGAKSNLTVSLLHNPSHLEAVNPVALGKTKAKQDDYPSLDAGRDAVLSLQLHGDSAYAGQGVVPESLQMAYLDEFAVGGTVHMIVNNQLGFTTGGVGRNRSSTYSSDIGKIISMPVLHVNADAPEAVAFAAKLVMDYQRHFKKDIMLDVIGYRRHGHNEVDEPSFTQPLMYKDIRSRPSVVKTYGDKLVSEGILDLSGAATTPTVRLTNRLNTYLEKELVECDKYEGSASEHFQGKWTDIAQTKDCTDVVDTGVSIDLLKQIGTESVKLPEGFSLHPRLKRGHVDARLSALASTVPDIDWATAECLAFASLVRSGFNLRLCGQDVERGTFSQRHHVLTDQVTDTTHMPLLSAAHRTPTSGRFQTVNSHLSEEAVLGFEYGYSWESSKNFNVWEAQFGDFNNGAQIMIDQFFATGETKWSRVSGITMLLPHGYDGAGPEHSSSRVERFLQMVDDMHDFPASHYATLPNGGGVPRTNSVNMIVANVTTPSNYFHLLRRQMLRSYRKPLVVITPKTLLRLPEAVSSLDEMAPGTSFAPVLGDAAAEAAASKVRVLVFISGKVFYDLSAKRAALKRDDIAFIRLEELCPFPLAHLQSQMSKYANVKQHVWFQEEPSNMGAYSYVAPRIELMLKSSNVANNGLSYVGRNSMPVVAVGAAVYHKKEGELLYKQIFDV